jgi:hypothetical protein
MTRRPRRWIRAVLTVALAGLLVWLPTAARAGITMTGLD